MSFYAERIVPHVVDKACSMQSLRPLRARACAGLAGDVVELGFGSGLNVEHYPDTVAKVSAVEPSDVAWRLASKRTATAHVPVERRALDGERLPFPDDSFDSALSTWTMCTIPDIAAALAEVRRVLKPGAQLHFLEHGLAPDPKVQRWQRRLDPLQKRLANGCTFSRPIVELLTAAGFVIEDVDVFYEQGTPKFPGALCLGVAVPSASARS